jgi:hypothetical protein
MISETHDHQIVLSTDRPWLLIDASEDLTKYWSRRGSNELPSAPAPMDLVNALTSENAVRSCAMIRQRLTARHIRFGPQATAWARHGRGHRRFRADILSVSLPAFSADGRHGIIEVNRAAYSLESGQWLVQFVRTPAGDWQLDGERGV